MKRPKIIIIGDGIVGLTTGKLLSNYAGKIDIVKKLENPVQPVVMNEITFKILADIWGSGSWLDLLKFISGGLVNWGDKPVKVVKSFFAVDLSLFKDYLVQYLCKIKKINFIYNVPDSIDDYDFVIDASGKKSYFTTLCSSYTKYAFGKRKMIVGISPMISKVNLSIIEALDDCWIYAAPINSEKALIQLMHPDTAKFDDEKFRQSISKTEYIKNIVENNVAELKEFNAFPSVLNDIFSNNRVSLGDSASSFDPICGDGLGNGLRSAILVSAIIKAIRSGEPTEKCQIHYKRKLYNTFSDHLKNCMLYYTNCKSFKGKYWKEEMKLINKALPVELEEIARASPNNYILHNFRLTASNKV